MANHCPRTRLSAGVVIGMAALACLEVPAGGADWANHPENVWVKQSPREGAPAPRFGWEGSGALDPHTGKWIHFGGHDGLPQGFALFTYDLETGIWEQRFPNTSPPGVCCVDGSNPFDPANRCFVSFPGGSLGHGFQWSRGVKLKGSNVWLYDPETNRWANMRPPPYKAPEKYSREVIGSLCSSATYDPVHEVVLTFGGTGAAGAMDTLFVYDAYANRLEYLRPANRPPARDGSALAYDAARDCLVMFGSQYLSDGRTWIYRYATNTWEAYDLNPHPPAQKGETYSTIPKMAYDSVNQVCLCLAWLGEQGGHETWAFDAGKMQWTRMNPAVEPDPSKSRSRNLSYCPQRNVFILETMSVAGGPQIWTYRYRKKGVAEPLQPPANLQVTTEKNRAVLTWNASSSFNVTGYTVYRAQADKSWEARFEKLGSTNKTTFEDGTVGAGQVYLYRVCAVAQDGTESGPSLSARTQPRVPHQPVVSVLAADRIEVSWQAHPAKDVMGYNVYRGVVSVATVKQGTPGAWRDNDPEYPEPVVVSVTDITDLRKLNDAPLTDTAFADSTIDLTKKGAESGDYRYAVYAYIVRAVNNLGTESGPSPYGLTIPAEPQNVMLREDGQVAELKWDPSPEKGVIGYRIYKLGNSHWEIIRVTEEPIRATTFRHVAGSSQTRYWVVPVDVLGQEGQPSSPVWANQMYKGFFAGEWHQ